MDSGFNREPLHKAHASLVEALAVWEQQPDDDLVRDAVLQRFE
jgi:hypothetical protein